MDAGDLFRKRATDLVQTSANAALAESARKFAEKVVERTPYDEGDAQAGWGFDAVPESADFFAGQTVSLVNREPYIRKLEEGSSDQAPKGMLAVTAEEFPDIVKDAARGQGGK